MTPNAMQEVVAVGQETNAPKYAMSEKGARRVRHGEMGRELKLGFIAYLASFVPGVFWVPKYNRQWLVGDLVSGVTLGLMTVPQGIAYAKLAQLPVQHGLYTAFTGHLFYAMLGTSREISVGPLAVPGLLTGKAILDIEGKFPGVYQKPEIASSLAMLFGLVCMAFGGLRIGILLDFVPAAVIVGFTTGLAMSLILSQLPPLLGIPLAKSYPEIWNKALHIATQVPFVQANNLIFGVLSLGFLFLMTYMAGRFGGKYPVLSQVAIGANAIIVVLATGIAFTIMEIQPDFNLDIIKDVPPGFGVVGMPVVDGDLWKALAPHLSGLFMSIVLESSAIAKGFSRKGGYEIAPSQEVFAVGVCNVGSSLFSGFPAGGAVSRAAVLDKSGVRTPMAGLFVALIVVASFYFLTPCFYYIPTATLAAIIFKAALSLFPSMATLQRFWRAHPLDLAQCLIASLVTFLLGAEWGIGLAVATGFLFLLYRLARPKVHVLAQAVGCDELFVPAGCSTFKTRALSPGVLAFRAQESIIFPNITHITQQVLSHTIEHTRSAALPTADGLWSQDILERAHELRKRRAIITAKPSPSDLDLPFLSAVILDLGAVNWIDSSGLRGLEDLQNQLGKYAGSPADDAFSQRQFQFVLVSTNPQVIATLVRTNIAHLSTPRFSPTSSCTTSPDPNLILEGHQGPADSLDLATNGQGYHIYPTIHSALRALHHNEPNHPLKSMFELQK
ncbi:hypothetical protein DSO57_1015364 [Entomophthora muscae]|uniref:Uncharacterized protein n=1 Tax=Entomophthora muscae TaxID=34485 RepID=A0ACC2S762_9FUNG|nr:hypothetical protein DSO57_1015364 [Entomophthora muscae]